MSLSSPERSMAGALTIANKLREQLDLPPVDHLYPGIPAVSDSCAITETVYDDDLNRDEWSVSTNDFAVQAYRRNGKGTHSVRMSSVPGAISFIKRFDKREFPDLIK